MSDTGAREREQRGGEPYVFECGHCGGRRLRTAVSYDRYGYAICPVCQHTNGPR